MIFVLENIRSAWNVGSILRTADAIGAKVILIGYTPRPVNKNLKLISKTAIGAQETVEWMSFDTSNQVFEAYPEQNHIGIEIDQQSQDILEFIGNYKLDSKSIQKKFRLNSQATWMLWFGNEIRGLDLETIKRLKVCLHLPMQGHKESLNVATSVSAAAYLIKFLGKDD